jgi:hypothetical protein
MSRIAIDDDVRAVAKQLGVPLRANPTDIIVDRCVEKVHAWAREFGPITSLEELLDLVCQKLCLHFEVVEVDSDLETIQAKYLAQRELAFADLDREFNATTDAVVIRLRNAQPWSSVRYVAVVDGRGKKHPRVWFSKWHEIAHLLAEPQTKFFFRRTQAFKREPIERLMDQIAGTLAFDEPLFLPRFKAHGLLDGIPRLAQLAAFASQEHPYASLQATLSAAIRHHPQPLILVEAKLAAKVNQAAGSKALRAVTTTHNPAALRARIFLHRNMRVPIRSVIYRVHAGHVQLENQVSRECLSWWESDNKALLPRAVSIEAMQAGPERVLALCSFG